MALTVTPMSGTRKVARIACTGCAGVVVVSVTTPERLMHLVETVEQDHACQPLAVAV